MIYIKADMVEILIVACYISSVRFIKKKVYYNANLSKISYLTCTMLKIEITSSLIMRHGS